MIHTIIVPGVGGSGSDHWHSWLQRQLMSCSRVSQADWNRPILKNWVANWVAALNTAPDQVQIVAHSFGCLTSLAALAQYPTLASKVKKLLLVAPANPSRFGENGFAHESPESYAAYFQQLRPQVQSEMIISENDPWLNFQDALQLAKAWKIRPKNLGQVGHINVASGFGPFPEIYDFLISENVLKNISFYNESKYLFKFAI